MGSDSHSRPRGIQGAPDGDREPRRLEFTICPLSAVFCPFYGVTPIRDEKIFVFPGARETVDALRDAGVRLALVTNGDGPSQRAKLTRFGRTDCFDHIQVEGEAGFGKPDARAYLHAMQTLGVSSADTWMVGDNLEWEVAAPQRLGIFAIWHDHLGTACRPARQSSRTASFDRSRNC